MKKSILIYMVFILMFSCTDIENQNYSNKVDSLLKVVQETQNELLKVKIDSIAFAFKNVDNNIDFFKKKLNGPIYDSSFLKDYSKYSRLDKKLKSLNKEFKKMLREVEYSKSQLDNLKKDIKNKVLELEKIREYFKSEKKALDRITKKIRPVLTRTKEDLKIYKQLQVKMDSIRKSLEQN